MSEPRNSPVRRKCEFICQTDFPAGVSLHVFVCDQNFVVGIAWSKVIFYITITNN